MGTQVIMRSVGERNTTCDKQLHALALVRDRFQISDRTVCLSECKHCSLFATILCVLKVGNGEERMSLITTTRGNSSEGKNVSRLIYTTKTGPTKKAEK